MVTLTRWQSPQILFEEAPAGLESDVYSFGITIYEVRGLSGSLHHTKHLLQILSGEVPFAAFPSDGAFYRALNRGTRPPKEPAVSSGGQSYAYIWDTAEMCWAQEPMSRFTMKRACDALQTNIVAQTTQIEPTLSTESLPVPAYISDNIVDEHFWSNWIPDELNIPHDSLHIANDRATVIGNALYDLTEGKHVEHGRVALWRSRMNHRDLTLDEAQVRLSFFPLLRRTQHETCLLYTSPSPRDS